jgi:hypothetical protein
LDLNLIEGEELASVTFLQESVQLDFSGPVLTLFLWPDVFVGEGLPMGEGSYAYGEPGYRDGLCLQLGDTVEEVSFEEGVALEIKFENGTIFRTSLGDEDYMGAEAGHFRVDQELMVF